MGVPALDRKEQRLQLLLKIQEKEIAAKSLFFVTLRVEMKGLKLARCHQGVEYSKLRIGQ